MKEDEQSVILEFGVQTFTINSYTIYENTILLRILKFCQQDISNAITSQTKEKQLVFSREETSEQMRHTRIPLCRLEPNKAHYPRLRDALSDMTTKKVGIPMYNESKAIRYAWFAQLFTISYTMESNRHFVILHTSLEVLRRYLSIAMGYHRLNLSTYASFSHFSTRQAYRFYYAYFSRNGSMMKPQFIASAFSAKGQYYSYASVKKDLLEPARIELEKRYKNGTSDIHFRYRPIYKDEDNKGIWSDNVLFTFIHRNDENPQGEKLAKLTTYQLKTKVALKTVWGVDGAVAESLSLRIRYSMLPELEDFFRRKIWYKNEKERKGCPLINKGGYIRKALTKFLDEQEGK